jgi:hypothetical protein
MYSRTNKNKIVMILAALLVASAFAPAYPSTGIAVSHLYKLSNFSGAVPYNEATISVDRFHDEIYVLYQNFVRIYNRNGMEVYGFGHDDALGWMRDVAVDEKGDIYLLSYGEQESGSDRPTYNIVRCNYRGESREHIAVRGIPSEYSHILPQRLIYREGRFFLVSRSQMLVVETDTKGMFLKGFNLADLLEIPEKDRPDTEIFGFSVDARGNMLFTIPVLFRAFRVSPDGTVMSFGKGGSAPGSFGVVTGIVADDQGNYLVADSQRSVVMVFDPAFRFITEFGYYGPKPQNLVRPRDIALGNSGKLYVVQLGQRGISVFSVIPN